MHSTPYMASKEQHCVNIFRQWPTSSTKGIYITQYKYTMFIFLKALIRITMTKPKNSIGTIIFINDYKQLE